MVISIVTRRQFYLMIWHEYKYREICGYRKETNFNLKRLGNAIRTQIFKIFFVCWSYSYKWHIQHHARLLVFLYCGFFSILRGLQQSFRSSCAGVDATDMSEIDTSAWRDELDMNKLRGCFPKGGYASASVNKRVSRSAGRQIDN